MGHDERHYPCECKERENVKTAKGFTRICAKCGHTFKEVVIQETKEEDVF